MNDSAERGPWYLLTGLLIGIVLGVAYTRYFQPVEYIDTSPALLRQDFKDQYRFLIAAAYLANGDLVRARARLELLKDPDVFRALSEQAQRTLAENGSSVDARALGLLAIALGQAPPGSALSVTLAAQTPTSPPSLSTPAELNAPSPGIPDDSALSTTTVTAGDSLPPADQEATAQAPLDGMIAPSNLVGPYVLLDKQKTCDQKLPAPLIEVEVMNKSGQPVAGVLVIITWSGGEERFYTGLKPEKGIGYADFTLLPEGLYSLRIGEGGEALTDISAFECEDTGGERHWGAWSLTFVQP